jgi:hypothetical protein
MRELNNKEPFILSILMGAFFVFSQPSIGQNDTVHSSQNKPDSIYYLPDLIDTSSTPELLSESETETESDTVSHQHKHSPRIAWMSSAILPGLGQAYNTKYWKIPIIYGGGAAIYFLYDYNNNWYKRFKTAKSQLDRNEEITDPDLAGRSLDDIIYNRDQVRRSRDYDVIFMGLLYVANIVDAMVDAYLFDYDVSKDLSFHLDPTILPSNSYSYTPTCGLKLSLRF